MEKKKSVLILITVKTALPRTLAFTRVPNTVRIELHIPCAICFLFFNLCSSDFKYRTTLQVCVFKTCLPNTVRIGRLYHALFFNALFLVTCVPFNVRTGLPCKS